jgi:hypothetical protein
MIRKTHMLLVLLICSLTSSGAPVLRAATPGETQKAATAIAGTWSGAFQSNSTTPPFTMTVVIDRDAEGRLVGKASHDSTCFKDLIFQITVKGEQVVLAGSDGDGDSVTMRGKIDSTGTSLTLKYIINGSAGGRCESDTGTGSMGKR